MNERATLAELIGALVTLALTPPTHGPGSLVAGSAAEDRALDEWARTVHERAHDLHREALGSDPKAVRIIELIQDETPRG